MTSWYGMWHRHIMVELVENAHLHEEKSNTINSPSSIACCALLTTHLVTSTITRVFSPSLVLVSSFGTLVGARACTVIGIDTLSVKMAAAFTITIAIAITVTVTITAAAAAAVRIAFNVVTGASSFFRYFLLFIGATNAITATTTAAYGTAAAAAVRSG